jgi:hypothetical protein
MFKALHVLLFFLALVGVVYGADQPFGDQFIGNPLLILTALIIIDVVAFAYRKIRK